MTGIVGGLLAATCCIGPAVGIATGAAAGSFLLGLGRYRSLLFVIAAGLTGLAVVLQMRTRRRSCASDAEYRGLRMRWIDATLVAFALTYGVGRFVVAPLIDKL